MPTKPAGPTLSHEELAALDLMIMQAVQRGAQPNDVLQFIDQIATAIHEVTHTVMNGVPVAIDIGTLTEITGLIGGGVLTPPAVEALRRTAAATAKAPSRVTLAELIERRRKAVAASRKSRG